jgi:hypothetical protein
MAQIDKPNLHFNTKLYTGNGSTQNITGIGFQPDWTWIKARAASGTGNDNHSVCDVVRTKGSYGHPSIYPNLNSAEYDPSSGNEVITDFISDGFALGGNENSNYNSNTYVSWNWKANGTGSANTDGDINSTVSANTTAGFSIVSYTGTGSNATVGHGLGSAPGWIVLKNRTTNRNWEILHHKNTASPATQQLEFITDATATVTTQWNSVMPTSSVFSIGTNDSTNKNGDSFIAYCFAEKTGYSKFGSYTANGSADGNFIYTGFAPKFIILKRTDTNGYNWVLYDDKRNTYNPWTNLLLPNLTNTEITSGGAIDFLSNGFKLRSASGANPTTNQGTIIYMAFGQSLVGSNNVPCTAR